MISSNAKFWIWITQVFGYNNPKVRKLYELYSDISEFYNGGESEWRYCGIFNQNDIDKLNKTDIKKAEMIIKRCVELKYSVLAIDDALFPECLRNIEIPPAVIYIQGHLPDVDNRLTIGIVGTRRATQYGIKNSYKIGYALSKYGVTVVSGGALGIDCASHRGSLAAEGITICVLGCGINYNYLRENEQMRFAITKRGAVISEYPPDEAPRSYYFPARNRLIAALSDGILIIESGAKSGSLITANYAGEQGKKVFALLGNNSPQNEGSNERIKDGTAIPVTDFIDILNSFDNLYATDENVDFDNLSLEDIVAVPVKGKKLSDDMSNIKNSITTNTKIVEPCLENKKNNKIIDDNNLKNAKNGSKKSSNIVTKDENLNSKIIVNKDKNETKSGTECAEKAFHKENLNLNTMAQSIYNYISNEPVHIDKISNDLGIPVFKVLTELTLLEMQGLVTALQGRRYILK